MSGVIWSYPFLSKPFTKLDYLALKFAPAREIHELSTFCI